MTGKASTIQLITNPEEESSYSSSPEQYQQSKILDGDVTIYIKGALTK